MDVRFDEIASDAMKLPVRDRVRLAQRLVASLDDESEPVVEALWVAEAERRLEEFRSGKVAGIDAAEAFKNAREALKRGESSFTPRLCAFYEERSEGLGAEFLAALDETTHRIQQFPDAGAVERGGLRKQLV